MTSRQSGVAVLGVGTPVLSGSNTTGLVEQVVVDFGDDSSNEDSNLFLIGTIDIILLVTVIGMMITLIVCQLRAANTRKEIQNALKNMGNLNGKRDLNEKENRRHK